MWVGDSAQDSATEQSESDTGEDNEAPTVLSRKKKTKEGGYKLDTKYRLKRGLDTSQ
jgi:hypothetical protein